MRTGRPSCRGYQRGAVAALEVSRKGMGMTAILDDRGRVEGIFTDGDRRTLRRRSTPRHPGAAGVMTANPHTIRRNAWLR